MGFEKLFDLLHPLKGSTVFGRHPLKGQFDELNLRTWRAWPESV